MKRFFLALAAVLLALPAVAADRGAIARYGSSGFVAARLYPGASIPLLPMNLRQSIVALTFDDGPDARYDPEILRLLAGYGAKATFFVVGKEAERKPELLRAMVAAGHEVGHHTHDHIRLAHLPEEDQFATLARGLDAIEAAGVSVRWFRPPFGRFDDTTLRLVRAMGMETILWTIDSQDYRNEAPKVIADRVLHDLAPGAVVLLHSNHKNTVNALSLILRRGKEEQFRFVTLSEWKTQMENAAAVAAAAAARVP